MKTKVIFRKNKENGEIIAVFPEIPSDSYGFNCDCYVHNGQHGSCDYYVVLASTVLATWKEYNSLRIELETRYDYDLAICKKYTYSMLENLRAEQERWRNSWKS